MASSIPTTGPYAYQPLNYSSSIKSTDSSAPSSPSDLGNKVGGIASRGGARNVLKSVSDALSKVSQFATQAKNNLVANIENNHISYVAAAIAVVGLVLTAIFAPPMVAIIPASFLAAFVINIVTVTLDDKEKIQITNKLRNEFGLVVASDSDRYGPATGVGIGVAIGLVTRGSAAERAGILKFDRITAVNGKDVYSKPCLLDALEESRTEGRSELTIQRGAETRYTALNMNAAL